MSAPEHRQPHDRWRLTRRDGRTLDFRFPGGITLDELRMLHRGFVGYEPISVPEGDRGDNEIS